MQHKITRSWKDLLYQRKSS